MHSLMKHDVRKAKILWTYSSFLGMDVEWNHEENQVLLSQKTNIEQKGWIQTTSKEVRNPMSNTINLRIAKPNPENKLLLPITGTLRYLTDRTRPDILVATGSISTGGATSSSDDHIATAERTINYLIQYPDYGLILRRRYNIYIYFWLYRCILYCQW